MKKRKVSKTDFLDELANMLPKERVERAKKDAEQEIFKIQLAHLRKKYQIRQEDIKFFSQSGISKIENRKDMKLSTLIQYLDNIGLGMEIKVYPKNFKKSKEEVVLLKA
jgi:hypothetical protein